jgi:GT2 family glycosyltransferase
VSSGWDKSSTLLVVPFFNPPAAFFDNCLDSLLTFSDPEDKILLIDDGTTLLGATSKERIDRLTRRAGVRLLRSAENVGIAATRNKAIEWAFEHDCALLIFLDADCNITKGFIDEHIRLHREWPDVLCIGGSIEGLSDGYWSHADNIICWYNNSPRSKRRIVEPPLNLCSTNLSVKLAKAQRDIYRFNENLETGEDIEFNDRVRRARGRIMFSPVPRVFHQNRVGFHDVAMHQYKYGLHSYPVRFGRLGNSWFVRLSILVLLLIGAPALVVATSFVTLKDWLRHDPRQVMYLPGVLFLRVLFVVATLVGTIDVSQSLPTRIRNRRRSGA